jgi:acyl-CoA thioester hydrolase
MSESTNSMFRFSCQIPVRYADIDAQRHVNNVAYFTFMEQSRVEYLCEVGLWSESNFDGLGMIVAEASCTYRAPAYLGETVTVWARISHLGHKSFHFDYRLETSRGEIATGRTVQVCYDYERGQSAPIPSAWRHAILAYEPALTGDSHDQ